MICLTLELEGKDISFPADILSMTALQKLIISFCDLIALPEGLDKPENLEELNLEGTPVAHIPECVTRMKYLKSITLTHKTTRVSFSETKQLQMKKPDLQFLLKKNEIVY
jgi:Leucine-rich repeat (LRR) protein